MAYNETPAGIVRYALEDEEQQKRFIDANVGPLIAQRGDIVSHFQELCKGLRTMMMGIWDNG